MINDRPMQPGTPLLFRTLAFMLVMAIFSGFFWLTPASAASTGTLSARVVLRKSANKDSKALQTLPEGDNVDILSTSGDWYKVTYGSYSGYVMKKFVTVSKNSVAANSGKISALGDAPGPLHIGDEGSDVKKLQKALTILDYYSYTVDGKYGDGTTVAVALYQQKNNLEADGVAGKTTIKSIFGSCAKNADITVSGEDTENNDDSSDSTSTSSSSSSTSSSSKSNSKSVSTLEEIGTAPSATKEGDSGTNVTKLQQALELLGYYSGDIDGDYGAKTISAVTRFQRNRGMNQDGIAGASTIRVLFGTTASASSSSSSSSSSSDSSSSESYKTITLDWFADDVSSLFPKKSHYVIKDVRTGKTFNAVRWSGVNHMDTEPATAEDTAIMKKIYGGTWSWDRRPILILFKGKVYAASMNGMPHGTSTINNDFGGHFCIHFRNSKTHGTDRVDPDHQKCVTTASKAKW